MCNTNAFCINTEGSYDCECLPGYSGNGTVCLGIATESLLMWMVHSANLARCNLYSQMLMSAGKGQICVIPVPFASILKAFITVHV